MLSVLLWMQVAVAGPPSGQPALPQSQEVEATIVEVTVTVTSDQPGAGAANQKSRMRLTRWGKRTRIDNLEGMSPGVMPGSPHVYSLALDSGNTLYSVDTAKKEFSRFDFASMKEKMEDAMSAVADFDVTFSGVRMDVDSVGPGEDVLGYETSRWTSLQAMTIAMSKGADTMAMSMESRSEMLYSPVEALRLAPTQGMDTLVMLTPFGQSLNTESARVLRTGQAKLPPGMPMRSVTKAVTMMGPADFTISTTSEVDKIEKVKRAVSFFEIPKDYKEVEMEFPGTEPEPQ